MRARTVKMAMAGVFCLVMLAMVAVAEEKPAPRVVFLPFTIQITGQYDYLKEGLAGILSTRVADRAGVQVVQGTGQTRTMARLLEQGKDRDALRLLEKSRADYLVLGSLEQDGEKKLLLVTVLGRKKGTGPVQFTQEITDMDQVIPVMDEVAWQIAAGVFGKKRPETEPGGASAKTGTGMDAFQTEHPDRAWRRGLFAGIVPGFESGDLAILAIRRSQKIPYGVNDMAMGDLDGDGHDELILAGGQELSVYRFADDHFSRIGSLAMADYLRIHAVSAADLDGDGRAEIYVSANDRQSPSSSIVLWGEREGRVVKDRIPFYVKVAAPRGRTVLLGQRGNHFNSRLLIDKDAFVLNFGPHGRVEPGEKVALPDGLTIFDVDWGDLDGDGSRELVAINRANQLQVFDAGGKLLFTDPGQYGASTNFLGTVVTQNESSYRLYIPPALSLADINGDGHPDLVVVRNRMKTIKYFRRYRYFEGSSIAAFTWQEDHLVPLWETRKLPDYTLGCAITVPAVADQGHNNSFQLFFAQGQNNYSFGFWQERSTSLFMYEIGAKKDGKEGE